MTTPNMSTDSFDNALLRVSLINELKRIRKLVIADCTTGMSRQNAWQLMNTANLKNLPRGTNAVHALRSEFDTIICLPGFSKFFFA